MWKKDSALAAWKPETPQPGGGAPLPRLRKPGIRIRAKAGRIPALLSLPWLVAGLVVSALLLRFAMRALGVRPDIPFPGLVYSITGPLVKPFYRLFPASPRFDYYTFEVASLVASGAAIVAALAVYTLVLLVYTALKSQKRA